jgi:crossover junction endodeoxyribonuclease RuvC
VFVLGIDPGLSRCGYGVVRRYGSDLAATAGGVVTTEPSLPLQERLRVLFAELRTLVAEVRPDAVVVERVFFQTNVRTAMATGQAGGVALLAAAEAGCEVAQYSANEVKMAVVGFGGATKDQVQRMVTALLGLDEVPRPPDVADALALAVCHLTSQPLRRAIEAAGAGLGAPEFGGPGVAPAPGVEAVRVPAVAGSPRSGVAAPPHPTGGSR